MKRATERKQRENFFFASHAINAKLVCSNESNKPVGLGHSVNFVLQRLVLTKDFDNFFFRFFSLNFFLAVLKSKQQSFGFFLLVLFLYLKATTITDMLSVPRPSSGSSRATQRSNSLPAAFTGSLEAASSAKTKLHAS